MVSHEKRARDKAQKIASSPAGGRTKGEGGFPETPAEITMECVYPDVDAGVHPAKRLAGETISVWIDIYKEGHDVLSAVLLHRNQGEILWTETPLVLFNNDRWTAAWTLEAAGLHEFTFEAWVEAFDTWRRDTERKRAAGQPIDSELREGLEMLRAAAKRLPAGSTDLQQLKAWQAQANTELKNGQMDAPVLLTDPVAELMRLYPDRSCATRMQPPRRIMADRDRAGFGAWYEMFPRSAGTDPHRSATLRECEARLPEIQRMGFDVLYFPPIHPIGHTHRKGRNNSLRCEPGEPGSPYAIGSELGGHDAVEPSLGTLEDFDGLVAAAREHGLEIALDFALNCSPDHPYVREHPEWFFHRPDGTIKYAENPPKRYEDIYPLNFTGPAWRSLWEEMARVIRFWAAHGVRIFRVDNPHTKPFAFWRWLIRTIQAEDPGIIFLSEAFTRPKVMKYLAKVGFTQSYTYFTWRNTKTELTEYLVELTQSGCREYFRPNFFTNTPDILPPILQSGGRAAFLSRCALAATLSPNYGIYSGFELCENHAIPGTEEYQDSEKYQFKVWDWDRPGNIKDFIARINQIRRENAALQEFKSLRFFWAGNDQILWYCKNTSDRDNVLLIAVNLDPDNVQESEVELPLDHLGLRDDQPLRIHELLHDWRAEWWGRRAGVRLDPGDAWILRLV